MFQSLKIKSILATTTAGFIAATSLSGCVVSDNPVVNALATTAVIGTVASLFYSINDGYYYDQSYNRMPRHYQPARNAHIQRIDNIDNYRRQHPLDQRINNQPRFERQDNQNNRLGKHRMPQRNQNPNFDDERNG